MTVGIMQPYLLPYIGYWQLLKLVDVFVIYDNIEFSKSGWFHRNYFLIGGDKKLFTISLKKDSNSLDVINRFLAEDSEKQIQKTLMQIKSAYRKAPYFDTVYPILQDIFSNKEKNLFGYIFFSIEKICQYLGINTKIVRSSNIKINHNLKAQAKVIAINKALKAKAYINTIGGRGLYDKNSFSAEAIDLKFIEPKLIEYKQFNTPFQSHMSIIDIMMFNSIEQISDMLENYTLIDEV